MGLPLWLKMCGNITAIIIIHVAGYISTIFADSVVNKIASATAVIKSVLRHH